MRRLMSFSTAAVATALLAPAAFGADYVADLTGAAQRPNPVNTTGTGIAHITITGNQLSFHVMVQNMLGTTTVAHIHKVNNTADPDNSTGGVMIDFVAPAGNPPPGWTEISGVTNVTDQQIADINAGFTYVNVHSNMFPAGEVRGKLILVPEPGSLAAISAGLLGLLTLRKRK